MQMVTEHLEANKGKLLHRVLELHNQRAVRPVWSWPGRDEHSAAWLMALPCPDSTLLNAEFGEASLEILWSMPR